MLVSEENPKEGRGMDEKLIMVLVLMPGGKFGLTTPLRNELLCQLFRALR